MNGMQMLNMLRELLQQEPSKSTTNTGQLSVEDAIDILSSDRRRRVISYLYAQDSETTIRELSEYLAKVEGSDRKTTYIALYQQHLEKLDSVEAVKWEKRGGVVKEGPQSAVLYRILGHIEEELDQ